MHISVEIEGSIYNHKLEADPNLKYTFTWDKRNVYKQKVSLFYIVKCSLVHCVFTIYIYIRCETIYI